MKKLLWLFLAYLHAIPFIILFFSSEVLTSFQNRVFNSDILYPFSIYQAIFTNSSYSDWVFGGYTPFVELVIGFILWVITRSIHVTFLLYAVLQPILVTLSLLYLTNTLIGGNRKLQAVTIAASTAPILLCVLGQFETGWDLFIWYRHGTTLCFGLLSLALLAQILTVPSTNKLRMVRTGGLLTIIIIISAMSDALFLSQFVMPSIATILLLWLLKILTFRKAAYVSLSILYASALGLAFYRLPALWGSDRVVVYGSYIQITIERLVENIGVIAILINDIFQGSIFIGVLWISFYVLSIVIFFTKIRGIRKGLGYIQTRLLIVFSFLLFQFATTFLSNLFTTTPGVRYMLPIVYVPIFWGWTLIAINTPIWLKHLQGQRLGYAAAALSIIASLILFSSSLSLRTVRTLRSYKPELVRCVDQHSSEHQLRRGMANYWQARLITLLSNDGLEVVQVTPELAPDRILNNTDGYREDFDFVIITHNPTPGLWMDREYVVRTYGPPAFSLYCDENEIMVYNRESDVAFKRHFESYFSGDQ